MKTKTFTLATIAIMMTASANAQNNKESINAAARLTRGSILKYNIVKSPIENTICLEYHIDENGDGKVDVIRNRINPSNMPLPAMQSPNTIMEIYEEYDPKSNIWNIVTENKINTRKPSKAPVYMTQQKTR